MSTETFELHAFRNGRWDVLEKFGPGEKASAIAAAQRTIASDGAEAVRVVREAFDDHEGLFKQKTIYRFGENRETEGRSAGASWMDEADRGGGAGANGEGGEPFVQLRHFAEAYGAHFAMALGGGLVAAVAAAWGWAHAAGTVGGLGVAAAIAAFVGVFIALFYVIRPSGLLDSDEAPGRAWVGAQPAAPEPPPFQAEPQDPYDDAPALDLTQSAAAPAATPEHLEDPHAQADLEALLESVLPQEWRDGGAPERDMLLARLFALGGAAQCGVDPQIALAMVEKRIGSAAALEPEEDLMSLEAAPVAATPEDLRALIDVDAAARDAYAAGAEEMRRFHIGEPPLGAFASLLTPPSSGPTSIAVLTTALSLVSAPRGLGPAAAQRLAEAHAMVVGAVVKARNGHVVKQKSSGVVAVFDRPGAAVDAAVMIQRQCQAYNIGSPPPHMGVRVGVATGAAAVEQGEYLGEAVRLSAQLTQAAALAEILIDSSTVAAVASTGHRLLDSVAVQPARAMRPAEATEDIPVCPVRWADEGRRRDPSL